MIGDKAGEGARGWTMKSLLCHSNEFGPSPGKTKNKTKTWELLNYSRVTCL